MNTPMPSDSQANQPFDLEHAPLERPGPGEHDWGGDGTDLSRPVRAHVLAALRPNDAPYPPPVGGLLALGDPDKPRVAASRAALGLRQQHLPDLLRMVRDRSLHTALGNTDEVWAPIHALAVLAELDLATAVPELLPLFDVEDDWLFERLPKLLGHVGAAALEPLRAYLADRTRWGYGHEHAISALEQIVQRHPALRPQAVAAAADVLRDAEHYHEVAVTAAMDLLVDLGAVETLPLLRRAFELGKIDEMLRGGWGNVLQDLGVTPDPHDPLIAESERHFEARRQALYPLKELENLHDLLNAAKQLAPPARKAAQTQAAATSQPRSQAATRKVGRNEPCPCGSGRKYKHCCGK